MKKVYWSHIIFEQLRNLKHVKFVLFFIDTEQIYPHLINCNDNPQDPFCRDGVSPRFCEGKTFGNYAHPSFCNKIIHCSSAGQDVQPCSFGLGYNSHISNCDWPGFLSCVDIKRGTYFFKPIKSDLIFTRFSSRLNRHFLTW